MNYPLWDVPYLGGSWIIGLNACLHIFVSHFAVGGGIFFALTEWLAYKHQDNELYNYLKRHSKFFLLLTTVYGAVSGVGIWWTVALVSPDGIASLIQTYTLGWALEYLFFVAELATIFVYYYSWDKISQAQHLKLARIYAVSSVFTLVIINAILTYMLTPGRWLETGYWLDGFFNPTYWPALIMRLLVMVAIAGMYALVTSAKLPDSPFRTRMLRYSAKWFLPVFLIGPVVAAWYFFNLPHTVVENLSTGILSSGVGNFSIMTRVVYLSLILSGTLLVFVLVGPYLNPRGFSFRMALAFLMVGVLVTSMGEWSREMLRKPYVIYNYLYSNGLHKDDIATYNKVGFLSTPKWQPTASCPVSNSLLKTEKGELIPNLTAGRQMFQYQCMACHTTNGYRPMKKLLAGRDMTGIRSFLSLIRTDDPQKNPYARMMPPLAGTDAEVESLALYLATLESTAKP